MEQQEFARYLLGLIDEEAEDEEIDPGAFYGYFQFFMPSGEGVERVFAPLDKGAAYLQRIAPIYEMLDPADFKGEQVPGYFIGKTGRASEEVLRALGEQLVQGLQQLFEEQTDMEGMDEPLSYLREIEEIIILQKGEIMAFENRKEPIIYETMFEIVEERTDYDGPIWVLSEAYYSIACDYWLSYYLQWPRYKKLANMDPLAPYFELYKIGYTAVFSGRSLYIGSY
ncbi:hypothetical protein [Paenibacillus medicaginis]|uniref:Uncharacterized protein n=1 Tax=Paenibacillus medicaginis TaxID=1470560 RepID=A0ABV5C1M6_9BACL